MKIDNVKIGFMEDQSILNSANKNGESYLDDLAFAVCVNGESLEKYKKIVEKKYGTDVYSNMVQFASTIDQQVKRRQFTSTSLLSLKFLGKNAGLSEMAIDMIVDHFRGEFQEEQLKEERRKNEDTAFWKQCNPNNKYQLQEYLKKFPTGLFAARAVSLIADLERIEKKAIEESHVFNQCHTQRDYMNYLSKYPNGTYSAKARAIIVELETEEKRAYKLCKDKSDYLGYLKEYPAGKYVKEAQDKIKVLEKTANRMAKETAFWNQCSPNSISQLQEYLRKYPNGAFAAKAKTLIKEYELNKNRGDSKTKNSHYVLMVDDVCSNHRGTWASGYLISPVQIADCVKIIGIKKVISSVVTGIKLKGETSDDVYRGDFVSILLRGVSFNEIERGDIIVRG